MPKATVTILAHTVETTARAIVTEQATEAVVVTDSDGCITYVNPSFERLTGYRAQEVVGQTLRLLQGKHCNDAKLNDLLATIEGGNMWEGTLLNVCKNGDTFYADTTAIPITGGNGNARKATVSAEKATKKAELAREHERLLQYAGELEKRLAERTQELAMAEEKLGQQGRTKTRFVSDLVHELRAPIHNLTLHTQLLGEPLSSERKQHYLDIVTKETQRLSDLVEEMLELSRLEGNCPNDINGEFRKVDLNALLQQVVETHRPQAEKAGLQLRFDPTPSLPPVSGKEDQLIRAIINLLSNAMRYTPSGSITVTTFPQSQGQEIGLEVQDTGIGIKESELSDLFQRFYRGSNAQKLDIPGTGLGLAIVKEIVAQHKGKIDVQSKLGAGTTFRISFPALQAQ